MSKKTITSQTEAPKIACKTQLITIGDWVILRLPKDASAQLPSRGQVMVTGTINGAPFTTPLEPDGEWSHWFQPSKALLQEAGASAGDTVTLTITPIKTWTEPPVPTDLLAAIKDDAAVYELWQRITPLARWEWVRWTRATNKSETRARRIAVTCDKLKKGMRRPCCWNRNLCTEPAVSKNGVLLPATS